MKSIAIAFDKEKSQHSTSLICAFKCWLFRFRNGGALFFVSNHRPEIPQMAVIKQISKSAQKGFATLYELEESKFRELVDSLDSAGVAIHPGKLAETILPSLKDINYSTIRDIFLSASVLLTYQESKKAGFDELIDDVLRMARANEIEGIEIKDGEGLDLLRRRLLTLVQNQNLVLSYRASDLFYDHENLFTSANVNVDIRPMILKEQSSLGIVSGTLHIEYSSEQEAHHIYLSVDRHDIKVLKDALEKAETDIRVIDGLMAKAGLKEPKADTE